MHGETIKTINLITHILFKTYLCNQTETWQDLISSLLKHLGLSHTTNGGNGLWNTDESCKYNEQAEAARSLSSVSWWNRRKITLYYESPSSHNMIWRALQLREYYVLLEDGSMECGIKASLWDRNFCTRTWYSLVLRLVDHTATSASTSKCKIKITILSTEQKN